VSDVTTKLLQKWADSAPQRAERVARELRKVGVDERFIKKMLHVKLKLAKPKALPPELPTFDPKVKRTLTPMLEARFRFAGTLSDDTERWLGPEDMKKLMISAKGLKNFKSFKNHWEGSAPNKFPESRVSLFGVGYIPDNWTYLVWPASGSKEPALYRYVGQEESIFADLNAFLKWATK
jgi:hypothetical protein